MKIFHYKYTIYTKGQMVSNSIGYCTDNDALTEKKMTDFTKKQLEALFYGSELVSLKLTKIETYNNGSFLVDYPGM